MTRINPKPDDIEERMSQYTEKAWRFRGFTITRHMRYSLLEYVSNRRPVGGFLRAVIENDLKEAVRRADDSNMANLPAFVNFLYNYAPSECWGSRKAYSTWVNEKD